MPVRARRLVLAVAVVAGSATSVRSVPAGANDQGSRGGFRIVASAEGFRVLVEEASLLPVTAQLVGLGGPVAQAEVDSLGVSSAFAALPDPGLLVLSGPTLFSAATGQPVPYGYPFAAQSSYPAQPDASFGQSGFEVTAHSEALLSEAKAAAATGTIATAHAVRRADGALRSEAKASMPGFHFGPVVIEGMVAEASVTRRGDSLERRSDLAFGRFTIAGTAVGFGPDGFTTGGTGVPVPDAAALQKALDDAGVRLEYLRPIERPDGIVSAGLALHTTLPADALGRRFDVTFIFGQAAASSAVAAPLPLATPGPVSGSPSGPAEPASGGADGNTISDAPITPSERDPTPPPVGAGAAVPPPAPAPAGPVEPPAPIRVPDPPGGVALPPLEPISVPAGGWNLYPVLVLGAVLLTGGCGAFVWRGRRT